MKLLSKIPEPKQRQLTDSEASDSMNLDLNYLLKPINSKNNCSEENVPIQDTSDDFLVDISDEKMLEVEQTPDIEEPKGSQPEQNIKTDVKLHDICVKLEDIKPSSHPPFTLLKEKNGITVTLHLAKDKPKDSVSVYVITTISKNELPFSNYLFQAVIPKVIYIIFSI